MAISIDWPTKVISVPQADLTLITGTLYEMDTDQFRKDINALQASENGMPFDTTHLHNTEVTVAGTTFARTIEIINGYSVTFTPDSQWSVRLVGSNNNIFDVENGILNQNQVQVIPGNSAGLIVRTGVPRRGIAWPNFQFSLVLSTDHATAATGLAGSITAQINKDDAGLTALGGTITEIGLGLYRIDLTAADMGFETGTFVFSEATADTWEITVRTAA